MTNWQTKKIDDVMDFVPTGAHSRNDMTNATDDPSQVFNIHYGDIHTKYSTYVNFDKDIVPVLKENAVRDSMRLQDGDLVVADASEDYDGVGSSVELRNVSDRKVIGGLHTFALRSKDEEFASGFTGLMLKNPATRKRLMQMSVYSKVYGLTKSSISSVDVSYPEKPEQERIVGVLEVWDEYIEKLEQKIALKEQLKKGLMQQLLTGNRRLPGFNSEWKEVRIGELGDIYTGNTPPMSVSSNYGGEHGWATAEDFKGKYVQQTRVTLSESGKIYSRFLPAGSVLVTCIASIGKNAIAAIPLATNQQINSIVFHRDYDNEFFYYLLCVKKNLLLRYAGAGAMPILNKGDFSKIKLLAPVDKNEQQAISRILGDLDREQDLLKEKRTFILNQKKYLLKNLITGIIRTPEDLQPLDASRLERSAL